MAKWKFWLKLPPAVSLQHLFLALAILLVAAGLRFAALERNGIWDDEAFTLRDIGVIPAGGVIHEGAPLYFMLLHGWKTVAGSSVGAIRAFSALCGVIGVVLVGLGAWRMFSPGAGIFAAAVVALHPFHLAYSQEARCYSMAFALAIAAIWAAWERRTAATVLCSATLLWTHPWGVFVWPVTLVLLRRWHALLTPLFAAPALWYMVQLGPKLGPSNSLFWARSPDFEAVCRVIEALAGGAFDVGGWRFSAGWMLTMPTAVFVGLWIAALVREDTQGTRTALAVSCAALVAAPLIVGWIVPQMSAHHRYFMIALPASVLLAIRGWFMLPRWWKTAAGTLLLAAFSWTTVEYFTVWHKGNIREAAALVRELTVPGTTLIVPGYMQPLWNFYDRSGLLVLDEERLHPDEMDGKGRVIFVTLDVPNSLREEMDKRYRVLSRRVYPAEYHLGLAVTLYETSSP